MGKSTELKQKYHALIEEAREFLNNHESADGTMSSADAATYAKMEKEIQNIKAEAQHESFKEERQMRYLIENSVPLKCEGGEEETGKPYVASPKYTKNFFKALRKKFKADNTLKLIEGSPTQGGYLVPSEFSDSIRSALEEENVIRQIATTIATESEHLIPFVATSPQASWISEGQAIELTTETFGRITLGAHKLGAAVTVSNELLADSHYDLQAHLSLEFVKAVSAAEEESFIVGDGNGKPTGILTEIASNSDCYKETMGTGITADDLIRGCW